MVADGGDHTPELTSCGRGCVTAHSMKITNGSSRGIQARRPAFPTPALSGRHRQQLEDVGTSHCSIASMCRPVKSGAATAGSTCRARRSRLWEMWAIGQRG